MRGPRGRGPAGSGYEYEFPIKVVDRDGKEGSNFVDLFKRDHFLLEAKDKEAGRTDELMMFAEDVKLLHDEPSLRMIEDVALPNPAEFAPAAEDLWRAMDHDKRFGARKLLRFNGHFFKDAERTERRLSLAVRRSV